MAIKYTMVVSGADSDDPLAQGATKPRTGLLAVATVLKRLASGTKPVSYTFSAKANATAATGTVVAASAVSGNTVTLGGVTLTAVTTGATGAQFNTTGGNTSTATALAAAINADATMSAGVSATSSGATVTITCLIPGKVGNLITLASSGATLTVSGATLSGGAETAIDWSF